MKDFLATHLAEIKQICQTYQVRRLEVFGSALSKSFNAESDVDLIVEFKRDGYVGAFEQFMGLKEDLEALLDRPVDLIVNRSFRNTYFQREVEATKQVIYAA